MEVAAIAMPYRPASEYEQKIATHTASTGHAVDFIDTPRPRDDVGGMTGDACLRPRGGRA
jgi:hypothetical protein